MCIKGVLLNSARIEPIRGVKRSLPIKSVEELIPLKPLFKLQFSPNYFSDPEYLLHVGSKKGTSYLRSPNIENWNFPEWKAPLIELGNAL